MSKLVSLSLKGFKSIRDLPNLTLGPCNVLIGANGAGKSNLISFFRLLNRMMTPPGELQYFVGKAGGASTLLFDGPLVTQQIEASLKFEGDATTDGYSVRLEDAGGDTLIIRQEFYKHDWSSLISGRRESTLLEMAGSGDKMAQRICQHLRQFTVFQFHNTSDTSRIKHRWDVEDSHSLKEDGANLAPFLRRLRDSESRAYQRIVENTRLIAPFFADFVLEPIGNTVLLQWRERNTGMVFGAHQASDGMLRTLALLALLLQPTKDIPDILILDEPELGLHPYAINVVAGILKSLSLHKQVLLATQSTNLIDYFEAEDIIVVERSGRESTFQRLDATQLEEWLEEYSLSELWEKNVLGGRPGR